MEYPRLCPLRYFTDNCVIPHDLIIPATSNYYRPWQWYAQAATKDYGSKIEHGINKYKISLDVQHFRPEEISVKASEKEIIIEGKHEERQDDHGYISRQFRRRYALPNNFPSENVVSSLSSDGILTIIAERKNIKGTEKIVPISFCGTCPRKFIKDSRMSSGITQKDIDDTIKEVNELIIKSKAHNLVRNDHSRLLKPEFMGEVTADNRKAESVIATDIPSTSAENILRMDAISSKVDESVGKQNTGVSSSADLNACSISSERQSTKTLSESIKEESSSFKSSTLSTTMKTEQTRDLNDAISAELREAAGII